MTDDSHSNRSAHPGEHAALRSRLEEYNRELNQLEVKVSGAQAVAQRANAALEECVAERDEVLGRARTICGLLHPIRRMPDELLQAIFAAYWAEIDCHLRAEPNSQWPWHEVKQSPFILASVTRGWRRVAMATSSHWSRIVLTFSTSWEEVQASALLDLQLRRSGDRDLTIVLIGIPEGWVQRNWLRSMLTGTVCERVAVLIINKIDYDLLSPLKQGHLPRLKVAHLFDAIKPKQNYNDEVEEEGTERTIFFDNAPMLHTFSVSSWEMDWCLFPPHHPLLSLHINEDSIGPYMGEFRIIVKQAPHIEDLVIIADILSDDNLPADAPPVLLASLKRITFLAEVHATSGYQHLLRLPELRRATLQIEWDRGVEATKRFLQNSLPPPGQCKLQYLQLQQVRADETLASVFRQLDALEELSFVSSSHTSTFCDALATSEDDTWILPRLQSLRMEKHGYRHPPGAPGPDIGMRVESILPLLSMIQRRQSIACSAVSVAPVPMRHCEVAYAATDKLLLNFDRHLEAAMMGQLDLGQL